MTEGREWITESSLVRYLRRRFPGRNHAREELLAAIVTDLRSAGYMTTDQLDRLVERGEEAAVRLDKIYHPAEQFDDACFLEAILDLVESDAFEKRRREARGHQDYFETIHQIRSTSGL
jgi:hypothetical protein